MAPTLKNMPLVSVIMPVYNAEHFLREALESILHQTYTNLEIIIVNDGSTDGSRDIILSYRDPRIVFIDNAVNGGLVNVMNAGLSRVQGAYIIRADADDISCPTRIAEQVQFMEQHQDVGVLSTWMQTIGASRGYTMKSFTKHEDICANLLFNTSLAQPSACICASMLKESGLTYDPAFKEGAEDYDLWVRASKVAKLACLPRVLVQYRVHAGSVSVTRAAANQANTRSIRLRQLAELDLTPTDEELSLHSRLTCPPRGNISLFLVNQERWLEKIVAANAERHLYTDASLQKVIRHRWFLLCDANARLGVATLRFACKSPFAFTIRDIGVVPYAKFVLKTFLRR